MRRLTFRWPAGATAMSRSERDKLGEAGRCGSTRYRLHCGRRTRYPDQIRGVRCFRCWIAVGAVPTKTGAAAISLRAYRGRLPGQTRGGDRFRNIRIASCRETTRAAIGLRTQPGPIPGSIQPRRPLQDSKVTVLVIRQEQLRQVQHLEIASRCEAQEGCCAGHRLCNSAQNQDTSARKSNRF